jgi:hypothetical protein
VSHVWVAGKLVYAEGDLKTMDLPLIRQQAADWQQTMAGGQK